MYVNDNSTEAYILLRMFIEFITPPAAPSSRDNLTVCACALNLHHAPEMALLPSQPRQTLYANCSGNVQRLLRRGR